MTGTRVSLTLPTRPMPPKITTPVHRAVAAPTASRGAPKAEATAAEMELDCTNAPPEREASTHQKENHFAARRQPRRPSR